MDRPANIELQLKSAKRYAGQLGRQIKKAQQHISNSKEAEDEFIFLVLSLEQLHTTTALAHLIAEQLASLRDEVHQNIRTFIEKQ